MEISKNYQHKKKQKQSTQSKKAYKPKAPFVSVEGIEGLLSRAEKVKRINTPKNLNDEEKSSFRLNRKQLLRQLRGMAGKESGGNGE